VRLRLRGHFRQLWCLSPANLGFSRLVLLDSWWDGTSAVAPEDRDRKRAFQRSPYLTKRRPRRLTIDVIDTLTALATTIGARRSADPAQSYVARLHAGGLPLIARKLGEEAVETIVAALTSDTDALTAEAADLVFHLLVLLDAKDVPFADVIAELGRREGLSGIAEKAARKVG
jgi:phosphoribosyl-ATP pyrophosphohydrolase